MLKLFIMRLSSKGLQFSGEKAGVVNSNYRQYSILEKWNRKAITENVIKG